MSTGAHLRGSAHPIFCVFCRKERMPGRERMNSRRIPSLIPIPIQWMNSGTLFLITATCGGRDRGASSVPASHMETGKWSQTVFEAWKRNLDIRIPLRCALWATDTAFARTATLCCCFTATGQMDCIFRKALHIFTLAFSEWPAWTTAFLPGTCSSPCW